MIYKIKEALRLFLRKIPWLYNRVHEKRVKKEEIEKMKKAGSLGKHGLEEAAEICNALTEKGFPVFLTYGSLLGVVRSGAFMDFDDDLDLGVLVKEAAGEDFLKSLDEAMGTIGYENVRYFLFRDKVREVSYGKEGLTVDIFLYETTEDSSIVYSFRRYGDVFYKTPSEFSVIYFKVPPIPGVVIREEEPFLPVPIGAENLLREIYGEGWKVPDPNWKSGQEPCRFEIKGEKAVERRMKKRS